MVATRPAEFMSGDYSDLAVRPGEWRHHCSGGRLRRRWLRRAESMPGASWSSAGSLCHPRRPNL